MGRDGSGTYTLPEAAFVFDTVISETAVNSNNSDIAAALTASIAKDGQTTLTGNLVFGAFKITGMGVGSAQDDSVTLRQVQANGYGHVASDTGAADAYAIAPSPAIAAYAAGQRFAFISANASTGASTVDVSGLGVKAIQYQAAALTGAEIKAGSLILIEYDGVQFQMISPSNLLDALPQGLDTSDSPQFAGIELGAATDTTITRVSAGVIAVEGSNVLLASGLGSITQAFDADTLKADTDDTLTAGFGATADADGTQSSGTYTPAYAGGNFKTATNGGAHTLAPQSGDGQIIVQYTNDGSAGAITTSGFDIVTGDDFTTTNGDDFMCYLTVVGTFQHLHITALQ